MSKTEDLKKNLAMISDAVNAFSSELVQAKIIDKLLNHWAPPPVKAAPDSLTLVLRSQLYTDYFLTPRSLAVILQHCNANFNGPFTVTQLSGLLLSLVKKSKLQRTREPGDKYFVYFR